MKDYSKLAEIEVMCQQDMDAIPDGYSGKIYIKAKNIYVRKRYCWSVVARENSSVEARENSSVLAWENSSVEAWGNSSVVARENSSVVAWGNVQIVDRSASHNLNIHGNSRIVYMPKSIHEFLDFYGVKHNKRTATMYKAVHKIDGRYFSHQISTFEYVVGEQKKENCDKNTAQDCSHGIHISHLAWELGFGGDWKYMAILELETEIDNIVLPVNSDGKVRTSEAKVLREVPLEECGLFGKILAKRRKAQ